MLLVPLFCIRAAQGAANMGSEAPGASAADEFCGQFGGEEACVAAQQLAQANASNASR
eukprot:SAG31_NODE_876_length_11307_cov_3.506781_6_plen_58_part_00